MKAVSTHKTKAMRNKQLLITFLHTFYVITNRKAKMESQNTEYILVAFRHTLVYHYCKITIINTTTVCSSAAAADHLYFGP